MTAVEEVPHDLWNEDGDRVWIRHDLYPTAGAARYAAYSGRHLPVGFCEMDAALIELRVRVVWARHAPSSEWDEWPWKQCSRGDEGAVKFWEVS